MSSLIAYAVPVFLLLLGLEAAVHARAARRRGLRGYEPRDTAASLAMGVGNVVVAAFTRSATLGVYAWVHQYAFFDPGRGAAAFVLAMVGDDFCYYWFHRAHHEVRILWAAHENHHSSRYFNLSTALRQSWTTPLTGPIFWTPLALLGVAPELVLTAQAVSLIYQFWIHTELVDRLGPLEWVFNTPSHHRVHHGRNPRYLDRNHGGVLIVWDRLFGTFEPESEAVDYGLTRNLETFHPVRIAFHEWASMFREVARAGSLREALGRIFLPPGWSPDGSTRTARELRRELEARHPL